MKYTMRSTILVVLLGLIGTQGVHCQIGDEENYVVPTFTFNDLQNGSRDNDLFEILTTTGLFAVRVPANEPRNLLSGLCKCTDSIGPKIHGGDRRLLADGLTSRSTIATATKGTDQPLPLPEHDIKKLCGVDTYSALERARDYVSHVTSDAFIPTLDRLIAGSSGNSSDPILTGKHGNGYSSISSIVADAVNLEHFHLYSKKTSESKEERAAVDEALDWHIDGGLFLTFLPGQSCNYGDKDDSFHLKLHGSNIEVKAVFPEQLNGEVIVAIMLGAGAERWLDTPESLRLRATRHAVKMRGGDERAWYGMMHLVASDAIVQTSPEITFSEFKKFSSHSAGRRFGDKAEPDEIAVGCGNHDVSEAVLAIESYSVPIRRRLQHVGGPEDCNNSDNFFCWLSCLDIPDDKPFNTHVAKGESLYCLDPSILATTNDLQQAVAACADEVTGKPGAVMNTVCANYWHETEGGIQSYTSLNTGYENVNVKYCYGGTGMYMQGFEWEGSTCIIFLFTSWVISTRAALLGACIGTIAYGMLVEFIIQQRRSILRKLGKGRKKMAWSAFLYGAQLSSSYLIMLVVMTFSGPLFISVILGLVSGHVAFNWKQVTCPNVSGEVCMEGSTPCCTNVLDDDESREMSVCETDTNNLREEVSNNEPIENCC